MRPKKGNLVTSLQIRETTLFWNQDVWLTFIHPCSKITFHYVVTDTLLKVCSQWKIPMLACLFFLKFNTSGLDRKTALTD